MSTGLETLRYPPTEQENYDELPIGFYFPWEKSMQSSLPAWFVECNGQLLDDADSPLDGEYIPNLNGVAKTKSATLNGTTTVTVTTTKDLYAGADVNGTSIPSGAKILSIDSDTEFTLDQSATGSGTETLTIGGNGPVFLAGNPTTGVWKTDQMQGHHHDIGVRTSNANVELQNSESFPRRDGAGDFLGNGGVPTDEVSASHVLNPHADGTNGEPRTGTETYPKHRGVTYVMKIKYSSKVKLITGVNVTGEEFGTFPEAGANVKPTDRLAVFYPDGSIYKNVYAHRLKYSQPKTVSSTPYTILEDDPDTILLNISSGTINLPKATGSGKRIKLVKIHATQNTITISPDGTDTITLAGGLSNITLRSQGNFWELLDIQNGVWEIISGFESIISTTTQEYRYADGRQEVRRSLNISAPSGDGSETVTWTLPFINYDFYVTGIPGFQSGLDAGNWEHMYVRVSGGTGRTTTSVILYYNLSAFTYDLRPYVRIDHRWY